ncbi:MAG: helix-hairpin-helix domain-containing protein [Armatimonadota bacterium]
MMRSRGVVLIVVLAALAGVMAGVAIYSLNQTDSVKTSINRSEQRRARLAAEAGIQYALASLQAIADAPQSSVTNDGDWAKLGTNGADSFIVGSESFRVEILDNSARLDLNTITEQQLDNLPLTQEQIDSFLDWREAGSNPRTEGGKDEYYNDLTKPYNTREGRLQTVTEVLQIKGWTPDVLFNVQTNTVMSGRTTNNNQPVLPIYDLVSLDCFSGAYNPEGNGKTNVNTATLTAQQLAQNAQIPIQSATTIINSRNAQPGRRFVRLSQVLTLPGIGANQQVLRSVLDRMTIAPANRIEGFININTATADVLSTLPGLTQDIANQIVDSRPTNGYQLLSEILTVSSDNAFLTAAADTLTVNSQSFRIRVVGKAGSTTVGLEAIVAITNTIPTIVRVEQSNFSNLPEKWSWTAEANQTTLLENK